MHTTDFKKLPRVDLRLSTLGLGCSQMGGLYQPTSAREVEDLFACAWAAGIRYFDTAPYYGYTRSEHRLGAQLADCPRHTYVVSTKVGRLLRPDASVAAGDGGWANPYPFRPQFDYSYSGVMRSFEDSQQRLGLAQIDILYVHDIGRDTHGDLHPHYWQQLTAGGGLRALDALRSSGAIKAVGLGVNEWQVVQDVMQEFDLDCTMLAGRYTLLEQDSLSPFLDNCLRRGNAIVLAGVFNSGVLVGNGKFNYGEAPAEVVARVQALRAVCAEHAAPLPAAALQFALAHPAVVCCVLGARSASQLQQNLGWLEEPLPAALWQRLRTRGLLHPDAPVPATRPARGPFKAPVETAFHTD